MGSHSSRPWHFASIKDVSLIIVFSKWFSGLFSGLKGVTALFPPKSVENWVELFVSPSVHGCYIASWIQYCSNSEKGLAETSVPKSHSTTMNHKDNWRKITSERIWLISLSECWVWLKTMANGGHWEMNKGEPCLKIKGLIKRSSVQPTSLYMFLCILFSAFVWCYKATEYR